jgi:hypothetical protein
MPRAARRRPYIYILQVLYVDHARARARAPISAACAARCSARRPAMLRATAMELQLGGDDASSDEDSAAHNPLLPAARPESRRQGSMVQPKAEAKPKVHPKIEPKIEPKRGRKRAQTEPDDKPARNEDGWLSGPDEPGASRKRPKQGDAVRVWFRHSDLHSGHAGWEYGKISHFDGDAFYVRYDADGEVWEETAILISSMGHRSWEFVDDAGTAPAAALAPAQPAPAPAQPAPAPAAQAGAESWFHVNSKISKRKQENRAFGPFLRHSIVSIGFEYIFKKLYSSRELLEPHEASGIGLNALDYLMLTLPPNEEAYHELRKQILSILSHWYQPDPGLAAAARQVAMWLTQVREGDYILMRHTYSKCKYTPAKLKTLRQGQGYEPVYALARVRRRPSPAIVGTKTFGATRYGTMIGNAPWADVEPIGLGFVSDLQVETRKYLLGIIQPTIARMAGKCKPEYKADLLRAATIRIEPTDFPGFVGTESSE